MAPAPDTSPAGRPVRRRPAARARLAVGFGSIGALAGLTVGLALDSSTGSAESAVPAPVPAPLPSPSGEVAEPVARSADWEEDDDASWWERVGAEVGARLFDEDEDDDEEHEYEEQKHEEHEGEYGEGWGVPSPGRSAPDAPQTRSTGS